MGILEELFVESCGRPGLVCRCRLRRVARDVVHASLMFVLSLGMSMMFPFSIFFGCRVLSFFNHMHFVRVDCVAALRTDGLVQHSRRESPVPFLGPVSGTHFGPRGGSNDCGWTRSAVHFLGRFLVRVLGPLSSLIFGTGRVIFCCWRR